MYICMFEQSGTFKNEFKKLGYASIDIDIKDDFGETDIKTDIFNEIDNCFNGEKSIFDMVSDNDLIMAFFPCVRFEEQILLSYRGENYSMKNWDNVKKLEYVFKLHDELSYYYNMISKLFLICYYKNLKMILENPYGYNHYLVRYFPIKPDIIDFDRRKRGDYFKKPTMYYFVNTKPKNNIILGFPPEKERFTIENASFPGINRTVSRSLISKEYANRFINEFIIGGIDNEI